MKNKNILAVIVQCRQSSTRLKKKLLLKIGKQKIIDILLNRIKKVHSDLIICAVAKEPGNESLLKAIKQNNVAIYEGSKNNVLLRTYRAAKKFKVNTIVRITSDQPLIDPKLVNIGIKIFNKKNLDYLSNNIYPSWPHGLDCEAVTFDWLDKAYFEANKPFEREHVMPWIRNHPNVKKANYICPHDGIEQHRWTIDNDRDLQFLRELWKRLPQGEKESLSYCTPLSIVTSEPKLLAINAGQDRFEGLKKSMSVS